MSILSDAKKAAKGSTTTTKTKTKSKTAWSAGPVETIDPKDGVSPMIVGLVVQAPYGTMFRAEGNFAPRNIGLTWAERVAAGLAALDK